MSLKSLLCKSYNNVSKTIAVIPGFLQKNVVVQNELRRSICLTSKCCDWYPKFFIHPIYRDKDLEAARESGELSKLVHVPVRPADSDHVTSVFHDVEVAKFTNIVMYHSQKERARTQVERAFGELKRMQLKKYYEETDEVARSKIILNPWILFDLAITNASPSLETIPIKKGGHTYRVPIPMTQKKGRWKAMKWLHDAALDKDRGVRFHLKLAWEISDAARNTGRVIKQKQDLHKLCEANRAYAHFRWT